jgi:hypothetical protein
MDLQLLLESFIGKTEEEAGEIASFNGYISRVTQRDDKNYICTQDYRMDRVNFSIENNKVKEAHLG